LTTTATTKPSIGERELIALLAALSATTALGIDMVLPAFGEIRSALGLAPDSPRVALTVTLYFLGLAFGQIFYGPFTDRFGRKPVLYFGLGLYMVGAVGSALAPSFGYLVAFRFLWGLGAAGPRTLTLAISRDLYEGDALGRVLATVLAVFMIVPAIGPLLGEFVLTIGTWRWVFATPVALATGLVLWLKRLPETLPPEARRPLTFSRTGTALRAVLANRVTLGSSLALMFDFGSFAAFLASSELLFDDVYGRSDQFAYYFGGMSIVMGVFIVFGTRKVARFGSDRVVVVLVSSSVALSTAVAVWSLANDGAPNFYAWFALITVLNSIRTLANPLIQGQAMAPMGELAGTAAAVIGTISMGGGAVLASFIDGAIDGSVTPLAIGYAGFGALGLAAMLWARGARTAPEPTAG
jgi:MFS transporter, DHA1 family, multidrug resistance protein